MKTFKEFSVHSNDKTLLNAFEQKLKEFGFERTISYDGESDHIIVYNDKRYAFFNHPGASTDFTLNLPQQWNEAIDYIKPKLLKPGDWVVVDKHDWVINHTGYREGDVFQLKDIEGSAENPSGKWAYPNETDGICPSLLRHATDEEIKQKLIKDSNLEIGDFVTYKNEDGFGTHKGKIKLFELITGEEIRSGTTNKYYAKHGMHLAVGFKEFLVPAAFVQKQDNYIYTQKGKYPVEKKSKRKVDIGCIKNLEIKQIERVFELQKLCKEIGLYLFIDEDGTFNVSYKGESTEPITIDKIGRILDKLD